MSLEAQTTYGFLEDRSARVNLIKGNVFVCRMGLGQGPGTKYKPVPIACARLDYRSVGVSRKPCEHRRASRDPLYRPAQRAHQLTLLVGFDRWTLVVDWAAVSMAHNGTL